MTRRTARIVVRGRVQGVGFRWFARDAAVALALSGWVRNRPDGSVELEAEGEPAPLEELCARLRRGPPVAQVTAVDVQWLPDEQAAASPPASRSTPEPAGAAPPRFEIRSTA